MNFITVRSVNRKDIWASIFLCLVMSCSIKVKGQVFFNSTQIPNTYQHVDQPALIGNSNGIRIIGAYRYQWTGIENAPMTLYAGADMKLPVRNLSGGIFLAYDKAGASSYTNTSLSISYAIQIKRGRLALGAKAGIYNMTLDGSRLTTPSQNTNPNDPLINLSKQSAIRPDVGLGVAYIHRYFQVGAFVNNVGNFKTKLNGIQTDFSTDFGRYYGLEGSAHIPTGAKFAIEPSFMLRMNGIQYQLDASLMSTFMENYSIGIGTRGYNNRSFESLLLMARVKVLSKLSVMYSYDLVTSKLNKVSNGSHEISFMYIVPKDFSKKKVKILYHPRYL